MKVFAVIVAMCLGFGSAIDPSKLTEEELKKLSDYLDEREKAKIEQADKYVPTQLTQPRQQCFRDEDCPNSHHCIDMPSVLFDVLKSQRSLSAFEYVRQSFGIESGECVVDLKEWLVVNATRVVPQLEESMDSINAFVNKSMQTQNLSGMKFFSKVEYDPMIRAPVARSAGLGGSSMDDSGLMLFLLLQAVSPSDNDDSGMNDMLLYLMLIPQMMGGQGGHGGNMLSNPLLLFSLMGNEGDLDSILPFILFPSLFDSNQGMGSVLPLFLLSSLGDDGSIEDIVPLIALMQTFGGSQGNDPMSSILPILLISQQDNENSDISKTFLLFAMMSGGQNCMGQNILPLLLLLTADEDSEDSEDDEGSDLMFTILLMQFLTGGNNGDMNSILPLLLLNGGSLGGDDGDFPMLVILLSLGNLGQGGIGSILPFLFMDEGSDIGLEEVLLISALGGDGLAGQSGDLMNLMLPLVLSGGLGDGNSMLPILIMLFSSGQTGHGCVAPVQPAPIYGGNIYQQQVPVVSQPAYLGQDFNQAIYMILMLELLGDDEDAGMDNILLLILFGGLGGGL